MRRCIIVLAALAALGFSVAPASAKAIKIKINAPELKAACAKAGGKFGGHVDGGGYGCQKANCDGKGNTCGVHCNYDGNCVGDAPGRKTGGMSVQQVLGYGYASKRSPATGGLLHSNPGLGQQGPAATGTPMVRPPASPTTGPVIIR